MKKSVAFIRHTEYYLNLKRFYDRRYIDWRHIDWRHTPDRQQIESALLRGQYTTSIQIEERI